MAGVTPALVTGGPSSKWNDTVDTLHSRVGGRIGRAGNTGTSKKTTLRPKQRTGRKEKKMARTQELSQKHGQGTTQDTWILTHFSFHSLHRKKR